MKLSMKMMEIVNIRTQLLQSDILILAFMETTNISMVVLPSKSYMVMQKTVEMT
jgi:hypothetical protein